MALLKAIPAWLYLVLALAGGWAYTSHCLRGAKTELVQANAVIAGNAAALETQKRTAAALLDAETNRVKALQTELIAARDEQEQTDAQNQITVDNLGKQLVNAGRLRDPNAKPARCGGGGSGTAGKAGSAAANGAANSAEADGVLSVELSDFLRRTTREADEINNAYASCRASLIGSP